MLCHRNEKNIDKKLISLKVASFNISSSTVHDCVSLARAITRPKIIEPELNVSLICNLSLYTHIPNMKSISQSSVTVIDNKYNNWTKSYNYSPSIYYSSVHNAFSALHIYKNVYIYSKEIRHLVITRNNHPVVK
jgi:hypothetical protein